MEDPTTLSFMQQDSGEQGLTATAKAYAVVRCRDKQTIAFLEQQRVERDAAVDRIITLRIAIHKEKARLKEKVEKYKTIYNGDAEKTWQVMCSLLAFPSFHLKPSDRYADIWLIRALEESDLDAAQDAFKWKANPNCYAGDGNTMLTLVLMKSEKNARYGLVKLLLDQGANPNLPSLDSTTPLHCAVDLYQDEAHENRLSIDALALVELLVEHGARMKISGYDPEQQELQNVDHKVTPLSWLKPKGAHNAVLVIYLLSHVYPDDICLGTDAQTITEEIIARNELFLRMNPMNGPMVLSAQSDKEDLLILNLLIAERYKEEFGALIATNVAKMMQQYTKKESVSYTDALSKAC